ncbi:MAG TPA: hypothetical protein VHZ99_12710 [Steroidobacteraceae bacterium]|jgi:hypothetical protein|nr:hypothetical protein [Steroidobacteraceae bacterium]
MKSDDAPRPVLVGTPSDQHPATLATGHTDISTLFVSMSARHPQGHDADYLQWHSLDHRPEQFRLSGLRAAFRLISTPACRSARAAADPRFDATDHLMTYLFRQASDLGPFNDLGAALGAAGRMPYLLPSVERSVYHLDGKAATARIKAGADVLPWWPFKGAYVLVEPGQHAADELLEVPGVGGAWWGRGNPLPPPLTTRSNAGLQITFLFLDDEPAATAERLRPRLAHRWQQSGTRALLAAPFHALVSYEWDRYLP